MRRRLFPVLRSIPNAEFQIVHLVVAGIRVQTCIHSGQPKWLTSDDRPAEIQDEVICPACRSAESVCAFVRDLNHAYDTHHGLTQR